MPATFANSRFDRKPRRTTSRALNTCGKVSTWEASSSIIRPSASSPRTGKKFSSVRMFSCRTPGSPEGFGCRLLAKASKIVSVRSGAKSKMYAFCFWNTCPARSKVQGFCARNAACMYWAGEDRSDSMMTAVHSGTVTPVVSCPTDRVMVLPSDFSASAMAVRTLSSDLPTATGSVSSSERPSPAARMTV